MTSSTTLRRSAVTFVAALLSLALLPTSAAENHLPFQAAGELTFQDEQDGPATIDIADCTFWVRGEGVEISEGRVDVYESRGRAGVELRASVPFSGSDFLVGPITLEDSDVANGLRIFAEVVVRGERTETSDPERYLQSGTVRMHCGETFIPCVEDLAAVTHGNGDVTLTWTAAPNATHYFVLRSDGTQGPTGRLEFETLANTTETTFTDTTAVAGESYIYDILSSDGALANSGACEPIEVTAVPFFGAPVIAALAVLGTAGAYVALRRR